ncbi:unnamed protein product, partial [Aureobasidium uvarum]
MPPASESGFFHTEKPLHVLNIADVQDIRNGSAALSFTEHFEYKGVLFVKVAAKVSSAGKRQKVEFPAVVLGQSQKRAGQMVLLKRPSATFQTVVGEDMKQEGGIGIGFVHWCSGLQLKWVAHVTPSTQVETGLFAEKRIQDARVALVKELYGLIDKDDDWSDLPWNKVKTKIDGIQRLLSAKSSPKKRQRKRNAAGGKPKKNNIEHSKKPDSASEFSEAEDWSDARVKNCGFDIEESKNLDDDEKNQVKTLMKAYRESESDGGKKPHHELAKLLDRAFVARFDIRILRDFEKAALANDDISSLPSFSRFADWWKTRDTEPRDRTRSRSASAEQEIPVTNILWHRYKRLLGITFQ